MRINVTLLLTLPFLVVGCTQNNVEEDEGLQKYFAEKNLQGTFGLFDNGHGTFTIYGLQDFSVKKYAPGPTFHLVNALIGIETGAVPDISTPMLVDTSSGEKCKSAHTLQTAIQFACDNWFVQLNQKIDPQKFKSLLDTLGYASGKGSDVLKGKNASFWNDTIANVTADEQLGLVKKLYFNKLPLLKRTHEAIKNILSKEVNPNYSMYYIAGGGWVIGWIEENQHPYFFSLYAEDKSSKAAGDDQVKGLLIAILKQYEFMQGKK